MRVRLIDVEIDEELHGDVIGEHAPGVTCWTLLAKFRYAGPATGMTSLSSRVDCPGGGARRDRGLLLQIPHEFLLPQSPLLVGRALVARNTHLQDLPLQVLLIEVDVEVGDRLES